MTSPDESSLPDTPAAAAAGNSPVVQAAVRIAGHLDEVVPASEEVGDPLLADHARVVRWVAPLFLGCAVVLLPWIVIAAATLPSHQLSENYDVAWAGYDVGLLIGLVWTALSALRRSARLTIAAAATGALLTADAWFDVLTSPGGWDLVEAIAMSVFAELPLAALCFWLAFHSQEVAERRLVLTVRRGRRR
jgi:hypothetical protein